MSQALAVPAAAVEHLEFVDGVWFLNRHGRLSVETNILGSLYEVRVLQDGALVREGYTAKRYGPAMALLRGMELALAEQRMELGRKYDPRLLRLDGDSRMMQLALLPARGEHISRAVTIVGLMQRPSGWTAMAFGTWNKRPHHHAIDALRSVTDAYLALGLLV